MKIKTGHEVHRGDCDCVRRAFHIVDRDNDLHGLAYNKDTARLLKSRLERKQPGLELFVDERSVFTIARHVDGEGVFS